MPPYRTPPPPPKGIFPYQQFPPCRRQAKKIKLDENLPTDLAIPLERLGQDADVLYTYEGCDYHGTCSIDPEE